MVDSTRTVLRYKLYAVCLISLLGLFFITWVVIYMQLAIPELGLVSAGCVEYNNQLLNSSSEITKADSAAASTLMTLLPALLVFGPFRTARISSSIVFSTTAALVTAGFTLGLATTNVMTLPNSKIFNVRDLCTETTTQRQGKCHSVSLMYNC